MKKIKAKTKRIVTALVMLSIMLVGSLTAYADGEGGGGFSSSILATGITKLINDVTGWITGIGLTVAVAFAAFFLVRRAMADEQDKKMWDKRIVTAVVSGIGVVIVTSMVSIIAGYFGG